MTITSTTNKIRYTGNGVLTSFNFPFKIFNESDLKVIIVTIATGAEAVIDLSTGYTVSINSITEGGSITTVATYSSDYEVFIKRVLPRTQGTAIPTESNIPEAALENGLDKGNMIEQELDEVNDRTIKVAETSEVTNLTFPEPNAGKAIQWNDAGTDLENSTENLGDAAAAQAAAEVAQTAAEAAQTAAETAETGAVAARLAAEAAGPPLVITAKTAAYTMLTTDNVISCDATSGAFTVTLYTAVGHSGEIVTIKKTDSSTNAVTVDGDGTETINGDLTKVLHSQNENITLLSNGTNWLIFTSGLRDLPVGTILNSMLTETQMAAAGNGEWYLMDGRSCTGTIYAALTGDATVPDAQGRFLRGKDAAGTTNPDGDVALGTNQGDLVGSLTGLSHTGAQTFYGGAGSPYNVKTGGTLTGGAETRPVNTTVNFFIRVN